MTDARDDAMANIRRKQEESQAKRVARNNKPTTQPTQQPRNTPPVDVPRERNTSNDNDMRIKQLEDENKQLMKDVTGWRNTADKLSAKLDEAYDDLADLRKLRSSNASDESLRLELEKAKKEVDALRKEVTVRNNALLDYEEREKAAEKLRVDVARLTLERDSVSYQLKMASKKALELQDEHRLDVDALRYFLEMLKKHAPDIEYPPNILTYIVKNELNATTSYSDNVILKKNKTKARIDALGSQSSGYKMELSFDDGKVALTIPNVKALRNPNDPTSFEYAAEINKDDPPRYSARSDNLNIGNIHSQGNLRVLLRNREGSIVSEDSGSYNVSLNAGVKGYMLRAGKASIFAKNTGDNTLKLEMVTVDT